MKLNKIKAMKSYFYDVPFLSVIIPLDSTIFLGDNWYVVSKDGIIIDKCLLDYDEKAFIEYNTIIEIIENNFNYDICTKANNQKQLILEK